MASGSSSLAGEARPGFSGRWNDNAQLPGRNFGKKDGAPEGADLGVRQLRIQPGTARAEESSTRLERKEESRPGEALPAFLPSLAERGGCTGRTPECPGSELLLPPPPPPLRALLPCCRRPSATEWVALARERNLPFTRTSPPRRARGLPPSVGQKNNNNKKINPVPFSQRSSQVR